MLVLAGPGSGKTRVLVHRIAYLLSVRREDPAGILPLAYNQHAAHEIRTRLRALVGDSARGVTVRTCHGFALWLTGRSLAGARPIGEDFRAILRDAARMLQGDSEAKESLLEGYRWILVDEYQDIGPDEYTLITAIAGLARSDPDGRRTLYLVPMADPEIGRCRTWLGNLRERPTPKPSATPSPTRCVKAAEARRADGRLAG